MASQFKKIDLDDLLFDSENPRLPTRLSGDQNEIFRYLAITSSISELMSAIAENGFFDGEAIIVVEHGEKYLVLEGNRRLTALKLLSGEVVDEVKRKTQEIVDRAKNKPALIPAYVYDNREEVINYLGNRHIAGVKQWGALAKARYVKKLYEEQASSGDEFETRCRTVANIIGSRRDFISKSLRAYHLYQFAESKDFFGLSSLDEITVKFSILSTSMDYQGIKDYLYADPENTHYPADFNPEHVKDLFSWMFVPREEESNPPLGESRNIRKLSEIISTECALMEFKKGATLEQAYLATTGVSEDFDRVTLNIQQSLRDANAIAPEIEFSETRMNTSRSIARQSKSLYDTVTKLDEI